MEKFNAVEFAITSAATAFDQVRAHATLEDAIDSYFDNLRDTLIDYRVTGQFEIADAEAAFWAEVERLKNARI